ncbi:MAG: hypothetical protein LIO81_00215 [Clostridiales bacterium]|nr:hypothetical protein [Clostridiales bacterium]
MISFNAVVTIIMMILIVIFLVWNKVHSGIVLGGIPIIAALIMGFNIREIQSFMNAGFNNIIGTLCIMIFAILYFGILHELGVFKWLVNKIMGLLKNSVLGVLYATGIITILTQMDGSGSTTAICTIPPLKPIYEKMHIRKDALVFIEGLGSGIFTFLPWAPAINEASAYLGVEAYNVYRWLLPVAAFAILLFLIVVIPILSVVEKRHGAGMSDEEYALLREEITRPVELPYGKNLALFSGILTIVIMGLLLSGIMPVSITFALGYFLLMILVFRNPKKMGDYLSSQSPMLINLTMTMLGVAIMVGINNGTGALAEIADVIAASNGSFIKHLPWLCCAFSMPLSFLTGNAKMSVVIPAVAAIAAPFGMAPEAVLGGILFCGSCAASVNVFSGTCYLAVNLAGVEIKDHIKYSMLTYFLFCIACALFLGITGRIPF